MKSILLLCAWWPATIFGMCASVTANRSEPTIYVIMAISSMGKTTQGQMLAELLGIPFYEPDDFHSAENRRKITEGIPLTDEDRWPWLERMRAEVIEKHLSDGTGAVMANSALKRVYRERLGIPSPGVQLVYLKGSRETAILQNQSRGAHFAPMATVLNNLAILEEPTPEENVIVVDVDPRGPDHTFQRLMFALGI